MGHRIPNHKSKCRNLHGHRYRAEITISGEIQNKKETSNEGMVLDFGDIKKMLNEEIIEKHDHSFMISENDNILYDFSEKNNDLKFSVVSFIPTAENIAKWLGEILERRLTKLYGGNFELYSLQLWETPTSSATYYG